MYTTTDFTAAKAALAERLNDVDHTHWANVELGRYLQEAIRTWSALTSCYRDEVVVPTTPGECFYDLNTATSVEAVAYCRRTVTDADLVSLLEYHLLETQGSAAWAGTSQFDLGDLTAALQRRRDQFLLETGVVLTREFNTIAPPPDGRIHLPDRWAELRRVAWRTVSGTITPLLKSDEWGMAGYRRKWPQQQTSPPAAFSVGVVPPLTLQLAPPPADTGTLDLVGVQRGTALDPSVGVVLGIPDDWAWVVTFGALADLLSLDGLAKDQSRAEYCEQRWSQGLTLAAAAPLVLSARIDNKMLQSRSLTTADRYRRTWQSETGAEPTSLLATAGTLFAVSPPPATGPYGLTVDVVRKAPIPVLATDYLQVGEEMLDVIYDYAQHLAAFKDGPTGVNETMPLASRFFRAAGIKLEMQQAQIPNRGPLQQQNLEDQRVDPRRTTPEPTMLTEAS